MHPLPAHAVGWAQVHTVCSLGLLGQGPRAGAQERKRKLPYGLRPRLSPDLCGYPLPPHLSLTKARHPVSPLPQAYTYCPLPGTDAESHDKGLHAGSNELVQSSVLVTKSMSLLHGPHRRSPLILQRAPNVSSNPQFKVYSIQIPGLLRWRPRNQGNTLSVPICPTHTVGVRPPGSWLAQDVTSPQQSQSPGRWGHTLVRPPHLPQGIAPQFLALPTQPPTFILSGLQGH